MPLIQTQNPRFTIQMATAADAALVVDYMKKLGRYQKMEDKTVATPDWIELRQA